jgi:hypothetical protein
MSYARQRTTAAGPGSPNISSPTEQSCAELPRDFRKEIATFARKLKRDYRALFASNPVYRKRAGQFLTALLPPKPRRRGRPGRADVTQAIRLLALFRRQYPDERPAEHWRRVYSHAIPNYASMSKVEQSDARQELRERVRWRQRTKRRYATKGNPAATTHRTPKPPTFATGATMTVSVVEVQRMGILNGRQRSSTEPKRGLA